MKRITHIVICLTLLFLFSIAEQNISAQDGIKNPSIPRQTLHFEHLSTEDGLSNPMVFAIQQDSEGFLWFGTNDGLNRYDGYQMTVYRHDSTDSGSVSNNTVKSIVEDSQGRLWIGTNNGLNIFNRNTGRFTRFLHDNDAPQYQ